MNSLFSNSYNDFSYWFSDITTDNNGKTVSDINAGIEKLIPEMFEQLNNPENQHTRFMVPDCQVYMPDIASQTFYNNENMWWYICFANSIDDPFTQYNDEYLFYAFATTLLEEHDINQNQNSAQQKSKIGTIVELN